MVVTVQHMHEPAMGGVGSFKSAVGEMGVSLFSCGAVDIEFFRDSQESGSSDCDALFDSLDEDEIDDMVEDVNIMDESPLNIKPEPSCDLQACPPILTHGMIRQMLEEALPLSLKTARWDRIYSVGRDGDTFYAMLNNCVDFKDTIVVAQTSEGYIVGGYASSPWQKQDGVSRSYFGTGQSFLFASHPEIQDVQMMQEESKEDEDNKPLSIFKWTGMNTFSQVCDVNGGQLAMGGGDDSFGLVVRDNFSRGTTGHCSTFGNPPLVPGGYFDIVSFEVYGFTSLGETTLSPLSSPTPGVPRHFASPKA